MGIEIERKFLVRNDAWKSGIQGSYPCTQGYIGLRGPGSARVRIIGTKGFLTLKGPRQGISRAEFEYQIPIEEARELLESFCDDALITKVRHEVPHEGHLWEIDEFGGENTGLILAEVEIDDESESFNFPEWVGKDISEDERFFNAQLAKHPISTWMKKPSSESP